MLFLSENTSFFKNLSGEPDTTDHMVNLRSLWSSLETSIHPGWLCKSRGRRKQACIWGLASIALWIWCLVHSNAHPPWCPSEHCSSRAVLPWVSGEPYQTLSCVRVPRAAFDEEHHTAIAKKANKSCCTRHRFRYRLQINLGNEV